MGKKKKKNIQVSVSCLVYNHEPFLRDCLEGFVMQKTIFPFEVIVHDDFSSDGSAEIIKEFAQKYPDIIKPVFEIDNQYSIGGFELVNAIIRRYLTGKYIASCEGDDYWTDPYKLQKQYDVMEKHPELDMCAHSSKMIDAITGLDSGMRITRNKECVLTVEETIIGEGGFLSTNSLFFRRELFDNIPSFRKFMDYDYSLQIQGALRGGILYLPEVMSVYRRNVPGSYSANAKKASRESRRIVVEKKKQMLRLLDQETNHAYHDAILGRFLLYDIIANNKQKDNIRSLIKNFSGLRMLPVTKQISILAKCLCPQLVRLCQKV